MNFEKKLRKMGIEEVKELNKESIEIIVHNVTQILTKTFPALKEIYDNILIKLFNCKMYSAKITKPISRVNYIYYDGSIYIDREINLNEVNEQILHECIHCIQDYRDINGKLSRIGLCDLEEFRVCGLGLNEAIVQYMCVKCFKSRPIEMEKYGIKLKTVSTYNYPFLTNLAEQIIYILGEESVIKNTLIQNNQFKDELYDTFEENTNKILNKLDKIVEINNLLIYEKNMQKRESLHKQIVKNYLETQSIIYRTFVDKICSRLTSVEEVEFYNEKVVYYIKNIMGVQIEKDSLNKTIEEANEKFSNRLMQITKEKSKMALAIIKLNWFDKWLKKVYAFFSK